MDTSRPFTFINNNPGPCGPLINNIMNTQNITDSKFMNNSTYFPETLYVGADPHDKNSDVQWFLNHAPIGTRLQQTIPGQGTTTLEKTPDIDKAEIFDSIMHMEFLRKNFSDVMYHPAINVLEQHNG